MEPSGADTSPTPSGRGIKAVLTKARRPGKDNDSPTPSVNSTNYSSEGHGLRSSIESTRDKLRVIPRSSVDDGPTSPRARKLSKLIPKRILKKVGNHGEKEVDENVGQSTLSARSQSTLGRDGASSQNTYDSEIESPISSTPAPISYPSQTGSSTSPSPLVESSHTIEPPNASAVEASNLNPSAAPNPKAFSVPDQTSPSRVELAPRHAPTLGAQQSETSLGTTATAASKSGRPISSGTRIKNIFTSGSNKIEDSSPISPDRTYEKYPSSRNTPGVVSPPRMEMRNTDGVNDLSSPQIPDSAVIKPQRSKINGTTTTTITNRGVPSLIIAPKTPPSTTIDAPQTTVTPPTPTDARAEIWNGISAKSWAPYPAGTNANTTVSASGNMISHRRVRSDSATQAPSKLSHAISTPLTPTIEESRTPGIRTPQSQNTSGSTSGFFSSVFSLAQNATNTLTNSLANSAPKAKISAPTTGEDAGGEAEKPAEEAASGDVAAPVQKNKLAIDTLGTGELTLNQLGIVTEAPISAGFTVETFPTVADGLSKKTTGPALRREEAATRADDGPAARTAPSAYIEKPQSEKKGAASAEEPLLRTGPIPTYEASISGEKTPPNGSLFEGDQGIRRSGSVRSRVGAVTRRHRNSSSATGNTVGTISTLNGASQTTLGNANASTPKLTGFAVASKKRNRDFHQLFRSIPEDDYLIEDYSCALQREILLAGRIYVSERHICFSSNILGWVTTVIISFDEIVSVEKENTAMVFPNAIAIQTLHARQTFRSLLSREATYELLIGIWRLSHPGLKSSLNGVHLDAGGTGDKTEKVEPSGSDNPGDISEEEEEVYDEDEMEEEGSLIEAADASVQGSEDNDFMSKSSIRRASAMGVAAGSAAGEVPTSGEAKAAEKAAAAAAASVDFPGPATHAPTECTDADTHYDKVVKDEIIPAPLGKVYSMMFGPASGGFMTRWFIDDQKMMDLQMEDDRRGLSEQVRTRSYSYIKPLYSSIGPKQTKCLITETLDHIDLERAVSVTVVTQTPDVPSGNLFSTRTKFCLSWAPGNSTRLVVNCMIEWYGKSWLKVPIEKGANDGQATYATDLVRALKAGIKARSRAGTTSSRLKAKGKRRKHEVEPSSRTVPEDRAVEPSAIKPNDRWGFLEPVRGMVEPVVDIVKPLIGANMVIGFLVLIQLFTWLRGGPSRHSPRVGFPQMLPSERIATYEEIWRREESNVWDWLEERIGMEALVYPGSASADDDDESDGAAVRKARRQRERSWRDREMQDKRREEGIMSEREYAEAIRATEKRLMGLKAAMQKKKRLKPSWVHDEN